MKKEILEKCTAEELRLYEELFGGGADASKDDYLAYIKERLNLKGTLYINKFISERKAEIYAYLNEYKTVRLIGGAGLGKTHFVLNELIKHYTKTRSKKYPLIVNFLNSVRDNQLAETAKNDKLLDRLTNRFLLAFGQLERPSVCNVANICDGVNIDKLLDSVSIVVIDEEHLIGEHAQFRGENITKLFELVRIAQSKNIHVLLMTATPINRHFDAVDIRIKLTDANNTHEVFFEWRSGLKVNNCLPLLEDLVNDPKKIVVVLVNRNAKHTLKKRCEMLFGADNVGYISSKQQHDTNGQTHGLIKNSLLDHSKKIYISTSFICEGVNINNTEQKITFVTFAEEVQHVGKLIQLSHRLRKQTRNIIVGYDTENKLYFKPRTEVKAKGEDNAIIKAEIMNYNAECVALFGGVKGSLSLWCNYVDYYAECGEHVFTHHTTNKGKPGRPKNDAKGLQSLVPLIIGNKAENGYKIAYDIATTTGEDITKCEDNTAIIKTRSCKFARLLDELIDLDLTPTADKGDKEIKDILCVYRAVRLIHRYNEINGETMRPHETTLIEISNVETSRNNRINSGGKRAYILGDLVLLSELEKMQKTLSDNLDFAERLFCYTSKNDLLKSIYSKADVFAVWKWNGHENKTAYERVKEYRQRKNADKSKAKAKTNAERMKEYRQRKKAEKLAEKR